MNFWKWKRDLSYLEYLAIVRILLKDLLKLDDERWQDDSSTKLILFIHLQYKVVSI